jgi:pimeloyl-ACP methyl ester carboxylesterase
MPAVANEIHLWLESQSITQAVMIGWSIGGSAVLSYCEHYGDDCLNGVGIVDVSPKLGASPDWELGEGTTLGSDILDKWVQEWGKNKTGLAHEIYSMGFRCPDQFASVIGELAAEAEFAHTEETTERRCVTYGFQRYSCMETRALPQMRLYVGLWWVQLDKATLRCLKSPDTASCSKIPTDLLPSYRSLQMMLPKRRRGGGPQGRWVSTSMKHLEVHHADSGPMIGRI